MSPTTLRALALLFVPLATACGGGLGAGAFSLTFPDNREDQISAVVSRLATPAPTERQVAVLLGAEPARIVAWDLAAGSRLFDVAADSRVAPLVAGDLVITHEGDEIVGRALANGAEEFRVEDETLQLIGADGEGDLAAITLSTGGGVGARSKLVIARGGNVDREVDLEVALGVPAVRAGLVFVPWGSQNVTVIDARSGDEIARIRISEEVLGHAIERGGAVYVGQGSVFRVTPTIVRGTRDGSAWLGASPGELPGAPPFLRDAYQPPFAARSALHRVRLDFAPEGTGESVAFADGLVYFTFYRVTFALGATDGAIRWARQHASDVVGAVARAGGLLVAESSGTISFLGAADGRPIFSVDAGVQPMVASFRGADFAPTGTPTEEPSTLADQLAAAAQNTDTRLVPAQIYAVAKLAALDDPTATPNLITLCDRPEAAEQVRATACQGMADRMTDPEQLLSALTRHARFLEGTTAPPVAALARAAARLRERRAVPHLVAHLLDPATPETALGGILTALGDLGDRSAASAIRGFLRLYHADERTDAMLAALGAGMGALVKLEGPVARDTLEEITADGFGVPEVRALARDAITAMDRVGTEAHEADVARQSGGEDGETPREQPATDDRPEIITASIVAELLVPVQAELTACLGSAEGRPRSARLILQLAGDGSVEGVSLAPSSVQPCIEPIIRSRTYPANRRNARQQVIHTIRGR